MLKIREQQATHLMIVCLLIYVYICIVQTPK